MGKRLCVGYVRGRHVSGVFAESLLELVRDGLLDDGWIYVQSGPRIASARNTVVSKFLEAKTADYLLMVDTDMSFTSEQVNHLLSTADEDTILGGLCFTGDTEITPTLYRMHEIAGKFKGSDIVWNYPRNARVEVDATGAAFILIPRKVLAAMRDVLEEKTAFPWFAESERDLVTIGEDVTFCMRARSLGFKVVVDTRVVIDHLKERTVNQDTYLAFRREYTEAHA